MNRTENRSKTHKIVALVTGRRLKWLVLIVWIAIIMVAGPLAGKLTGAEKNDNSSWLPGKAESTQVLKAQSKFESTDLAPAVMVYERPSGLTEADKAKIIGDAATFAKVKGIVPGTVKGPIFSPDGKAAEKHRKKHLAR